MATTTTDVLGRSGSFVAVSCLGLLAACGGGSSGTPPISLKGATFSVPATELDDAVLRQIQGGTGTQDFRGVIFVDDGLAQFLEAEDSFSGRTVLFVRDNNNLAILQTPDNQAATQYEHTRILIHRYVLNGVRIDQEGVLGRFTSESLMATASGSAVYEGNGTALVRVSPSGGGGDFTIGLGDTVVDVDFDNNAVDVVLNNFREILPTTTVSPFDEVRIDGMTISGSEFSGGTFLLLSGGSSVSGFDTNTFQSSGIFAGWRDANGAVLEEEKPAEVGGAFVADTAGGKIVGRYAAD